MTIFIKELIMKKTIATIAAVTLVAMTGLFAQPAKGKKADAKPLPPAKEFKAPPKFELPAEADVKAYHEAQVQSFKTLLDAQVKAKIITPEWAEAKMAILKAVQADCKGFCIIRKSTDIPFGAPAFGGPGFGHRPFPPKKPHYFDGPCPRGDFKPNHDGPRHHGDFKGRDHKRRHHPNFDPNFNDAPQDAAEEVEVK